MYSRPCWCVAPSPCDAKVKLARRRDELTSWSCFPCLLPRLKKPMATAAGLGFVSGNGGASSRCGLVWREVDEAAPARFLFKKDVAWTLLVVDVWAQDGWVTFSTTGVVVDRPTRRTEADIGRTRDVSVSCPYEGKSGANQICGYVGALGHRFYPFRPKRTHADTQIKCFGPLELALSVCAYL